jgi:hypothetical protein
MNPDVTGRAHFTNTRGKPDKIFRHIFKIKNETASRGLAPQAPAERKMKIS